MKNFLSRLVSLLRNVFGNGRNYGCLPDTLDSHAGEKKTPPAQTRPETANSVEKDASLR
jgi:hypothetical protein